MERCTKTMSEEICLRLLLFNVLTNLDDGRTLIKFGNDTSKDGGEFEEKIQFSKVPDSWRNSLKKIGCCSGWNNKLIQEQVDKRQNITTIANNSKLYRIYETEV